MTLQFAKQIIARIKRKYKNFIIVGSIARREEFVDDIDIMLHVDDIDTFTKILDKIVVVKKKYKNMLKCYIPSNMGEIQLDVFLYNDDNYILMKFMLESPKKYNIRIRRLAKIKGYKLSQYGLYKSRGNSYIKIPINNEDDIFTILGVTHRSILDR